MQEITYADVKKSLDAIHSDWAEVKKIHEDEKEKKQKLDADVQTLLQADAVTKAQLETLTKQLNENEMTIARYKNMQQFEAKKDERLESMWEVYGKTVGDRNVDRKAAKEAFMAYAKHGANGIEPDQKKLLSTQDNANGGYLLMPEIDSEIDKILADTSGVRTVARVTTVSTMNFEIVQRTGRPTVSIPGEGTSVSATNSTYGRVLIPNKMYVARVAATEEEVADAMWSVETMAREDVAEEIDLQQGQDFVSGTGVNEPEGLWTNASIVSVNSGSASAITYEGLVRVSHGDTTNGGFNRNYIRNGVFALNLVTLGSARLLEDGGSTLIFQPGVGDITSTLVGFPYVIFPDAPNEGSNTYPVMFGDFNKGYRIIDRTGTSMLVNPFLQADQRIINYHFARRTGAKVTQPSVLRKLKCST